MSWSPDADYYDDFDDDDDFEWIESDGIYYVRAVEEKLALTYGREMEE